VVNRAECEFCVYHVKAAYKASSSQRQSLQSSFSGGASLTRKPRKDVKDDGFGGKLNDYVPVVGRKSAQSRKRDDQLLAGLGGGTGGKVGGHKSDLCLATNIICICQGRDVAAVVASGRDRQGRPRGQSLTQQQKVAVQQVSRTTNAIFKPHKCDLFR
jgi:hypothetical protein